MTSYLLGPLRWWDTRPPLAQFPFRLIVLLVAVFVLVPRVVEYGPTAVDLTTGAVAWAASSLGLSAAVSPGGRMTFADGAFWYDVIPACTTVIPTLCFAALVVAYPATWRQRVIGLSVGIPALFVWNLVRLVGLAWAGVHGMTAYDAVHWVGFQALLLLPVPFMWAAWVNLVVKRSERLGARPSLGTGWWRGPAIFAAVFAVLGSLALLGPVRDKYVDVFSIPFHAVTYVIGAEGSMPFSIGTGDFFVYPLSTAAFLALFLATHRVPLRDRLNAVKYVLLPLLYATQFVDLLVTKALGVADGDPHLRDGMWGGDSSAVTAWMWELSHVVLLAVVPFVCWLMWSSAKRDRVSEDVSNANEVVS